MIRKPKFIDEIQITNNDPSKSMHTNVRREKPIRVVVHEDIHYFSYKMTKGKFLFEATQKKGIKHTKKLINKLKIPLEPDTFL